MGHIPWTGKGKHMLTDADVKCATEGCTAVGYIRWGGLWYCPTHYQGKTRARAREDGSVRRVEQQPSGSVGRERGETTTPGTLPYLS